MTKIEIAALVAAVVLNATPLYDGYRMLKNRSTGSYVPLPACAMLCNASIWTLYGVPFFFFSFAFFHLETNTF